MKRKVGKREYVDKLNSALRQQDGYQEGMAIILANTLPGVMGTTYVGSTDDPEIFQKARQQVDAEYEWDPSLD